MFATRKQTPPPRRMPQSTLGTRQQAVFSYRGTSRERTAVSPTARAMGTAGEGSGASVSHKRWLYNIPAIVAVLVILFSVVYSTTLTQQPVVQLYGSTANNHLLRDKTVYQQTANDLLRGSLFNRSKLTINSGKLAAKMQQAFPELDAVTVAIPLVNRNPQFQLHVSQPVFILTTDSQAFVVDAAGKAVIKLADVPANTSLAIPVLKDMANAEIKAGERAATTDMVRFIQVVTEELKAKGLTIESLTLPTVPEELDVKLVGQPYILKFNFLEDARQQSGAYLAARDRFEASHTTPSQYVDLRVAERVYYK